MVTAGMALIIGPVNDLELDNKQVENDKDDNETVWSKLKR